MERLFDRLFGPRDFAVIMLDGQAFAYPVKLLIKGDTVLRTGLRCGKAQRIARSLRLKSEDTPEQIL